MITLNAVHTAKERIQPYLYTTPLLQSALLQLQFNKTVWLKLETQLPTGSFKPRAAFNNILSHLHMAKEKGVIAASSGNFAQGVAYAAKTLGIDAMIVMTENTLPYKIERTKQLGANVILCKNSHEERVQTTLKIQKESGRLLLHPYNSLDTIEGNATIGLEISEQMGPLDDDTTILVPVSGGGLLAGVAFCLKSIYPSCKILGVQPQVNSSLAKSLEAGKVIDIGSFKSIADALATPCLGEQAFDIIQDYIDGVILVTEEEIKTATSFLMEQHKLVVEPAGAVSLAALWTKYVSTQKVICIVSGGNIQLKLPF